MTIAWNITLPKSLLAVSIKIIDLLNFLMIIMYTERINSTLIGTLL